MSPARLVGSLVLVTAVLACADPALAGMGRGLPPRIDTIVPRTASETPPPSADASGLPAACRAAPSRGPCKAAFPAWWFDASSSRCKPFLWGGCGDPPPFTSIEDCERTCRPR